MPDVWSTMFDETKGKFTKIDNMSLNESQKAKMERNRLEWEEQQKLLNGTPEDVSAQAYQEAARHLDDNAK